MKVSLRAYRPDEFERICDIRELNSPESRERFIARISQGTVWVDHYLHLAIDVDGALVGDVQLRKCDHTRPEGALEMGLELDPSLRGKGIGTLALRECSKYAFNNGAHRVEGSTDVENLAMRRAFEKAGWNFEGVLKALFIEDGVPRDYYSYAITKFD
jgi:RimJ/RimL family protein N-acetyltransferase